MIPREAAEMVLGKAEVLADGEDVCIMAVGSAVNLSLRALEILQEMGISAALLNARFVKPLDEELILDHANRCHRIVTVEENAVQGGFGSAVIELLASAGLCDVQVRQIGLPDEFVAHGARPVLRELHGLDPDHIARVAADLVAKRQPVD